MALGGQSPLLSVPKFCSAVTHRSPIEQLFKDCKTGGYHLEDAKVNDTRFLALVLLIALAYSWATMHGQQLKHLGVDQYAGRIQEHHDKTPRQSDFSRGLYGQRVNGGSMPWSYGPTGRSN